jgi:amino acid transporter
MAADVQQWHRPWRLNTTVTVDGSGRTRKDRAAEDRFARPEALPVAIEAPESLGYRIKCRLLGPPLTNVELKGERLSKKTALGVLSSDCISSSAYGSEEILLVLIPLFGLSAYTLLLPLTGIVLVVLVLVTLTYRWVVTTYTAAGGSYVVARENFGPVVAQVGAVALMLDYVVTVAVQAAAGTAAVTSALPALSDYQLEITVGVVIVLFCGNLRGLREAGRLFAFPTYFFVGCMGVVIVGGLVREILGDLPYYDPTTAVGAFPVGEGSPLLSIGAVYILLRSFANGGSSLTGLEAISNGVSTFRPPQGLNARRTLVIMSTLLGTLVAGVSWLAHETHAVTYESGSPTVISQVAKAVLGDSIGGQAMYFAVQLSTMLILWTGANTPFNGFPYLANFVAADGFLPRWLTKRGHRLAFSNGIIVLAVIALALILGTGAHVDKLVAFYAIGVFTGFTLAGFGMARYFTTHRDGRWRAKVVVNTLVGAVAGAVVLIFAVTKFTEGAWLVVLVFPVMVVLLLRLRRTYQEEDALLRALPQRESRPPMAGNQVLLLVDTMDLATFRALTYARNLRPTSMRAVHFMIDPDHASALREAWDRIDRLDLPLEIVDCPDRRLGRAALELAERALVSGPANGVVTVLLPRRQYGVLVGRLLHDRTADEIAAAVSQVRGVAATIVPFDASTRPHSIRHSTRTPGAPQAHRESVSSIGPTPSERVTIAEAPHRGWAVLQGRIRSVESSSIAASPAYRAELCDESGGVTLLFYGRRKIEGLDPGALVRVEGRVGERHGYLAMANPSYQILPSP